MRRLNVRCCCTPTKIFGTMEVPDNVLWNGATFPVLLIPEREHWTHDPNTLVKHNQTEWHRITVMKFRSRIRATVTEDIILDNDELAVYSDDRPREFWLRVPTFQENQP